MYGMETPPTRDAQRRKPSGAPLRGLSGTLKVCKPGDSVLNTEAGEGMLRPPSNPQPFAPPHELLPGM